jgi:hypothetical protein
MTQPGMKKVAITDRMNGNGVEIKSNKLKARRRTEHTAKL